MTPDQIVTVLFGASVLVGGVSAAISQTKWVKDRPGLERLLMGVSNAAGRLKQAIPPGTTAAQAEAMVAAEAVKVASNYADSAKVSGADQAAIAGMISGALGHALPVGHIVPGVPPMVQTQFDQLVADFRAAVMPQVTSVVAPVTAPPPAAQPAANPLPLPSNAGQAA
jgi:hypothetical protein